MAKKPNAEKTEQQTVTLFADHPVKYNGQRYYNVAFDADTDTANELIREGVCTLHVEAAEPAPPAPPIREQVIAAAIAQLKLEQFDADDKPSVKALSKITDSVVTADERDAAWAKVQAAEKPAT